MVGCHTGNPLVFEAHGIKVYGGGNTRAGAHQNMNPKPDVAIGPEGVMHTRRTRDNFPKGWSCASMLKHEDMPLFIEIDWPDFGIPNNITKEFWPTLVEDFKKNNVKSVSCSCMGGHGRTGVQLCILAHLMLPEKDRVWEDAGQLINHIREVYCDHAVEGLEQQEYIAEMLDIPVGKSLFIEKKTQWVNNDIEMSDLFDEIQQSNERNKKDKKRKLTQGKKFNGKKKQKDLSDFTDEHSSIDSIYDNEMDTDGEINFRIDVGKEYHANAGVSGQCLFFSEKHDSYIWVKRTQAGKMDRLADFELVDMADEEWDSYCGECSMGMNHRLEMLERPEEAGYKGDTCKFCFAEENNIELNYDKRALKSKGRWYPATYFKQKGKMLVVAKDTKEYKDREKMFSGNLEAKGN